MTKSWKMIIWLVLAAVVMRLLFSLLFDPLVTPDSNSYLEMARWISSGDLSLYTGQRTPVYPLILLFHNCNIQAVVLFQAILGIVISLLICQIFIKLYNNHVLGFIAGLSYALNLSQIAFERAVLTETTATILVVTSSLFFLIALEKQKNVTACVFLGVSTSLVALVKPLFQFLPVLFSILLAIHFIRASGKISGTLKSFISVLLPVLFILGSWSWFNYSKTGYFGVSTMLGMGLMNHTGAFIEDAPPEYEAIKKVFLKYREQVKNKTGRTYGAVHLAKKELMEITGQDYIELNKTFVRLSFLLIRANPTAYLKSVSRSFGRFWHPTWYTNQGGIRKVIRSGSLPMVLMVGTFALAHALCMLLFWVFPLFYALYPKIRKHIVINFQVVSIYMLVFSTAIFQSLLEYSENSRYKAPVEPLIIGIAVVFAVGLYRMYTGSLTKESNKNSGENTCSQQR
jgi:4-amino-4-deoxy-L-arabinose transferase-like glycosyltransferase